MAAVVHLDPVLEPRRPVGRPHLSLVEPHRSDPDRSRRPTAAEFRRRRLLAAVAAVVLVGVSWWLVSPLWAGPTATAASAPVGREVVVRPGDTLWGIAAELGIEGDLRDAVARLAEFNGGAVIRPGEVVEVPADLLAG